MNDGSRTSRPWRAAPCQEDALQVWLLTGFLGSGKTTLLRQWAQQTPPGELAVIINEFADVGIDQEVVHCAGEGIVVLEGGCACCVVKDDLVEALHRLKAAVREGALPRLRHVIVETSGLADPNPIVHALRTDPRLRTHFAPAIVLAVVDASQAMMQLDEFAEAAPQVAAADRLLLSKLDLAIPEDVDALEQRLASLNPLAARERVHRGGIAPPPWVGGSSSLRRSAPALSGDGVVSQHSAGVMAHVIEHRGAVHWPAFADWLQAVCLACGRDLLRAKAIVHTKEAPGRRLVNAVRFSIYPPEGIGSEDSADDPVSKLVFIGRNLDAARLQRTLAAALR